MDRKEACRILKSLDSDNKTAITVVMELAQQLRTDAVFEEGTELHWNTNSFKFNARLGDITAVGEGRSKKEAKQNSAKELINVIGNYESRTNITSPQVGLSTPVRQLSSSPNPSSSGTSDPPFSAENAIGELQVMAARNKWKLPEYEFPVAQGDSHCKTFTCLVKMMSDLQCEGSGSTKKAAKKHAAEKMLDILQGDEVDSPNVKESTPSSPSSPSYNQGSSSDSSHSSDVDDDNSSPCRSDSPSRNLDHEGYFNVEKPMEKLEEKRKVEGFTVEFFNLPNKSKKGLYQVFIKLTFNSNSKKAPVVTFGSGETDNIAKNKCACRALEHLEIMKSVVFD